MYVVVNDWIMSDSATCKVSKNTGFYLYRKVASCKMHDLPMTGRPENFFGKMGCIIYRAKCTIKSLKVGKYGAVAIKMGRLLGKCFG